MPESDEKRQNDQFDVPWKDILEAYFPDFIEFFLPEAFADIDWSRRFEFLNTEFARISRDADIGDRRMDKLVKVWRRDGKEFWVLIHIEIQGNRKTNFASGMYVFQYRAYDLYQVPVVGLAILADEELGWRPTEFGYEMWGTKQSYQFTSVKLLDYSEAELEQSTNPFAIVALVHLQAKRTKHRMEERYQVKSQLIRSLSKRGFSRQQVIDLLHFIDWVLHLPKELADQLMAEIIAYEESQQMPYITSFERIGEERGEERGRKEEAAAMLIELLACKFGQVADSVTEKVTGADRELIGKWSKKLLFANSLDDVFTS
ncbi:MAG: hypothetical protein H7839_22845 [Magnetococcus sp. YQC-5]